MNSATDIQNLLKQVIPGGDNVFLTRFPVAGCEFIRRLTEGRDRVRITLGDKTPPLSLVPLLCLSGMVLRQNAAQTSGWRR